MDTCQEFAALLDLYVDGELPPAEAERVPGASGDLRCLPVLCG